jgi:hypothetical protein
LARAETHERATSPAERIIENLGSRQWHVTANETVVATPNVGRTAATDPPDRYAHV